MKNRELAKLTIIPEEEAHRMGGELLSGKARYVDPLEFIPKEEYFEMCGKVLENYRK
jgi:hypothetical protein